MKRAKKRLSPILAQLVTSTRRANRAMTKAIATVDASNKRLTRRKPKYSLDELLAQIPPGDHNLFKEWDTGPPVGKEIW
jgi:hypothetical protein